MTVTLAVPRTPSLVAVTVVAPGVTAVRSPVAEMVATPVDDDVHEIPRPVRAALSAEKVAADICSARVTITFCVAGVTLTNATGTARTVTGADPRTPSTDAEIVAVPGAMPATVPSGATLGNCHIARRPRDGPSDRGVTRGQESQRRQCESRSNEHGGRGRGDLH
ncbi:MAG: hypothetical protein U0163_14435 [Gemmatimonadaceae bacterium]